MHRFLHRVTVAHNLAPGHRVVRGAAAVLHPSTFEGPAQLARRMGRPVVREQLGSMLDGHSVKPTRQDQHKGSPDIRGRHGGTCLPGNDRAGAVIEGNRQVASS
jgi:hypothetical protein